MARAAEVSVCLNLSCWIDAYFITIWLWKSPSLFRECRSKFGAFIVSFIQYISLLCPHVFFLFCYNSVPFKSYMAAMSRIFWCFLSFLSNQAYPVFLPLHTVLLCFRFPPDSWKAATQLLLVKMMSWSNLIMVTDCFPLLFIYLFCFSLRFRLCVGWAAGQFVFANWCSVPLGRVLWRFHPCFPRTVAAWQCLWHSSRFAFF